MGSNSMVQINGFWFLTAQDCLKISLAYLLQQQQVPSSFHRTEMRSEEHTSELQSQSNLVCRLLLEKKKSNFILAKCHMYLVPLRYFLLPTVIQKLRPVELY